MYLGRVVGMGQTYDGHNFLMYRLASREFPHRQIVEVGFSLYVEVDREFALENAGKDNLTYCCTTRARNYVVVGNGDHVDTIQNCLAGGGDPLLSITRG